VDRTKRFVKCFNDNCNADDHHRHTPLTYAAYHGHVKVVRVLLEGGANIERANGYGSTALHIAAWNGQLDVCRLLLDWGAKVDVLRRKNTPLHDAAERGHLSVVKLLVESGADVGVKNDRGQTASDVARSLGKKDVADWLDSVRRGKGALTV
jgi:ankyrin repeat protein